MPLLSKQKRKSRDQPHTKDGKYHAKRMCHISTDDTDNHNLPATSMLINNSKSCEDGRSGAVISSRDIGDVSGDACDGRGEDLDFEWSDDEWVMMKIVKGMTGMTRILQS